MKRAPSASAGESAAFVSAAAVATLVSLSFGLGGCTRSPLGSPLCAPHDAACQMRAAAMQDPTCKNGTGSNMKCLDPNAPP